MTANPPEGIDHDATASSFRGFAALARPTCPTYARISLAVAADPELVTALAAAPETQQNPVLLFAAVHWLLLNGVDHPLGSHYATVAGGDPTGRDLVADFGDFVRTHDTALRELVAGRVTQTNEVGRGAILLPGVAVVAREVGPVGLIDLGASAGLNLLMDRWTHRWRGRRREVVLSGEPDVELTCELEGRFRKARRALALADIPPAIPWRLGLDRLPVDLADDDAVGWLLACVWPDAVDRFRRLRAAVEVARRDPPPVRTGDVVDDLPAVTAEIPDGLHPVATTSWVLNYLPLQRQRELVATLDTLAKERDCSLVAMESPHRTPGLDWPPLVADIDRTVLGLWTWRRGVWEARVLATAHPHGHWLDPTLRRRT